MAKGMVKKVLKHSDMTNNIKVANAPCSWGALEFELEGRALGFEQVLDELAETGYIGTELGDWGFMPTEPARLQQEIQRRGLNLLGAFVPVGLSLQSAHEGGVDKALKVAGLMHAGGYADAFVVLSDDNGTVKSRTRNAGRIGPGESLSQDLLKVFGQGAEWVARAVKDQYGMRTVFHHHCAGYIETPEEIESLLSVTDPALLGLCFDTGHFLFGGGKDPAAMMAKHYDRLWHVHFKDFSPTVAERAAALQWDYFDSVKHGVFCELGKGSVDFGAVTRLLKERDYQGWIVVEQDVLPGMGDPKRCAANNRAFLRTLGL